jgi:hypothetical protein
MKIKFTQYMYPEDWNFARIFSATGHSREVDVTAFEEKFWDHGESRELAVEVELDTETGYITVVGQ